MRARKSWHLALAALWAAKRLQLNSSHWMGKQRNYKALQHSRDQKCKRHNLSTRDSTTNRHLRGIYTWRHCVAQSGKMLRWGMRPYCFGYFVSLLSSHENSLSKSASMVSHVLSEPLLAHVKYRQCICM